MKESCFKKQLFFGIHEKQKRSRRKTDSLYNKDMKRVVLIMAGGSGERFWPLSRKKHPKQLLALGGSEKTMLQEAVDRVEGLIPKENIYILTSKTLQDPIQNTFTIPKENVIAEPCKRNTAPCLALGIAVLENRHPNEPISIAVLTADHVMNPQESFQKTIQTAMTYAETTEHIVTIGIKPSRAETGYGYIEQGKNLQPNIYEVRQFREKPNEQTAEKYVEMGNFLWNSGMFFFQNKTLKEEMVIHIPSIGTKIEDLKQALAINESQKLLDIFKTFPDISIDFGVMEKSHKVVMTPALFEWDDIGNVNALERTYKKDENGNITIGPNAIIHSHNCICINKTNTEKIVATVGMHNTAIVITDDAVLVCNRNEVQHIKKAVGQIRDQFGEQWL